MLTELMVISYYILYIYKKKTKVNTYTIGLTYSSMYIPLVYNDVGVFGVYIKTLMTCK